MCTKKGAIISRTGESLDTKKRKGHNDPGKKRGAAKKRFNNKKESIKQYKRGKYLENQTSIIMHQKAKYQENLKTQQAYQKCRYKKMLKLKYNIKKKYQQNVEIDKKYQKQRYQEEVLIIFAQYDMKSTCINVVSDCASMKNIIFSLQNCIYVKHVISILIKMKFHVKQFAIK